MDFDNDGVMKMLTELWIFEGDPLDIRRWNDWEECRSFHMGFGCLKNIVENFEPKFAEKLCINTLFSNLKFLPRHCTV